VDYCVWHDNSYSGTITAHVEITWLKADNSFISTVGTTHTYSGTGAWYRYIDTHVAPALAATAKVRLWFSLPYGYYLGVNYDDVYMFVTGTAAAMDRKPRAALWPRDLTGYDYVLHTSELETGLAIDESTRDLANNVAATYGTASVTAFAGNTASQTTYRKREAVVAAGSVAATVAAAMRDTYLAEHLTPKVELAPFTLARRGALRTALGAVVWPESVRAGHRVLLADGPNAGSVFVVATTGYNNGAVTLTPERLDDTAMLLARR
jgi:hypothetical protein